MLKYSLMACDPAPGRPNVALKLTEALAHPARLTIVRLLAELPDEHTSFDPRCGTAYGVCFCHLKEKTGLSGPTVSHHLKILREAGLVEGVRVGRWTYFRLKPGGLEALAHELLHLARQAERAAAKAG